MSPIDRDPEQHAALMCLRHAIAAQTSYLTAYERRSEAVVYETLRTFDDLFCRDLMEPARAVGVQEQTFRAISTWGVNHALRRVIPAAATHGPFRDFPSISSNQSKADDFIFNCGAIAIAERLEGWLDEGILKGELRRHPRPDGLANVLVLRSDASSCYDEQIGMAGLSWAGDLVWRQDRGAELALESQHQCMEPELQRHVHLVDGWQMTYSSTRQIDDYFLEWAKLYLRRIFSQDMVGLDDVIGGRPFSRYLDVLAALSARSQKHIAFAAILLARHPSVHMRNLLTTYCPRRLFIESLAEYMDADCGEVESILRAFTLEGSNLDAHTRGHEVAWAPIVQASTDMLILPTYGVDINPFLFLLTDLRFRYEADWFRVANNREGRWISELDGLLARHRWQTCGRNVQLREAGKVLTDLDFSAYDAKTNELALFQLKWQHPIGMDNRARRSAGKNLVTESNRWVATVTSWLERHGVGELMQRLAFGSTRLPSVRLFVLGRYHVYLGGYEDRDSRAVWSDWAHFRRVCIERPKALSVAQLVSHLQSDIQRTRAGKTEESMAFPIGDIAVVLNPTSVPA